MSNLSTSKIESIYALFKGEPGTRKSTAALSFPTPQYWFSYDRKMNALRIPMQKWGIDPLLVEYDDYDEYNKGIAKLNSLVLNCKYKTIVIDSITSMADAINRQTMRLKSGTTNKEGGEKGMRIGGIPVNSIEDYKAEASAFQETIAVTKDIAQFHNCNIILIGHVVGERSPKEGELTHFARVIVTGGKAISGKIAAYSTEIYHFNVIPTPDIDKPPSYGLFTVHTGGDFARTALLLANQITFNDKSLYAGWLKPAIDKLNEVK